MIFLLILLLPFMLEAKPKILVGSPVRQKTAILKEFLESCDRLEESDKYELHYCFINDNIEDGSNRALQTFSEKKGSHCLILPPECIDSTEFICNEHSHNWTHSLIWKIASFKDRLIEYAKEKDYDYLFLVDSDLVLAPQTLEQLMLDEKEIVSNIYWTAWALGDPLMPQVWISDNFKMYKNEKFEKLSIDEKKHRTDLFLNMLKEPGVYEVGGLGSCTLISQSALNKGILFKKINLLSSLSEDHHFCIRADVLGIPLFVDTHYPGYHIYRESDLAGVEKYKKETAKVSGKI